MKSKIYLLILFLLTFSIITFAQTKNLSKNWKKFSKCNVTFSAPRTLKDLKSKQDDACNGDFADSNLRISVFFGNYGERFSKLETMSEFKEEATEIDGKKTQLVTYIDNYKDNQQKMRQQYVAGIYVSVVTFADGQETVTSLVMTIDGKTKKDLETARQIFKTIKFEN